MIGPLSSQLNAIKWGEFRLGDLFEIRPTKAYNLTNPHLFDSNAKNPVVTNSSLNNGISGYSPLEPTEKGNQITYSDTTTSEGIFYQKRPFIGYSHVQGLYPLKYHEFWNEKTLLYIVAAFKKVACGCFDYGNKFNRKIASEMLISLPTNPHGGIDFDFMEKFIAELEQCRLAELEQCRLAELEAYLKATGLENTTLSNDEENALSVFNGNNLGGGGNTPCGLTWQSFKLGDLFEMERGTRLTKANRIKGTRPLVTAGYENYGVAEYISNHEQRVFKGNTITIDMFGCAFYRYSEYSADDNILVLTPKFTMSHRIGLCVTARINAVLKAKFSYGKQYRQKDFNVTIISLPLKPAANTQTLEDIDFDFMRTLINALMKQTIQGVVQYSSAKIQATKEVISQEAPVQKDSLF
ncbi:restriction endonuclease subunit S [Helicobacter pylori]